MITDVQLFIGFSLTLAAICIYFIWFKPKDIDMDNAIPGTIILMPIISIFAGLLLMFGVRWIDSKETISYKPTCNIVSIRNNDVTSGNFMLGCGSIKQTEYYFYFYKTLNGGYARGRKNVNKTVIVEDNTKHPHIEILKTTYESKSGWFKFRGQEEEDYKIIVPKNTILNKFELY
jgi:hypothetical protein